MYNVTLDYEAYRQAINTASYLLDYFFRPNHKAANIEIVGKEWAS